jgi:restriction endonuclease S subunit
LKLNEILKDNNEFRINSEFYKKKYIQVKMKLLSINYKYLSKLNTFNARYGQPNYDKTSNIKVLNSRYLRDYFLDYDSAKYGFGSIVQKNAIMINATGVGTLGRVNINYLRQNFTIDNHINIIIANNINPYYLMIFLKSYYGQSQINRYYSGSSGQIEIYSKNFDNFIIPIFSNNFQLKIENLVKSSHQKLENSKSLYKQAEQLILKELDLLDYKSSKEKVAIKNLSESFGISGRLDSEYYQPKYNEILEKIKNYKGGFDIINTVCKVKNTNYKPNDTDYYQYIELSNIGTTGNITGFTYEQGQNLPSRARRLIKENDVIISSIEGSLEKIAIVRKEFDNSLCSTGFYVINSKKINSETLLVLFKNKILQQILKQNCSGTILTAINKDEFLNIPIPIIDNKIQIQIEQKIKKSFELKEQSKELLDIAKKAVEIAIEEDEDIAMEYINDQI